MWEKFTEYKADCLDIADVMYKNPPELVAAIESATGWDELSRIMTNARCKYL